MSDEDTREVNGDDVDLDAGSDFESEIDGFADSAADLDEPPAVEREPSGWQPPEPTGVQAVDDAVAPLTDLDELSTAEHVSYYETAHRRLQDALADLDGS